MADPAVKAEPIDGSPGEIPGAQPADEEDLYEDAGDLEFYDPNAEGNRFEAVYLARLPKYLWEGWAKLVEGLNDDDEVRLGTLRTWQSKDAKGEEKTNLRMLLQPHSAHQALPMEYDMEVIDKNVQNHFVFSEEDLPGFKAKSKARSEAAAAGIPASLLRAKTEATTERKPYDRRSRFQPYYRKAVPKKTKIFGKIAYDVRVEPVDKREEEKLLERRLFEADHKNTGVQIIGRGSTVKAMQSGTTHASKWGDTFIKTSAPLVKPKKGEHLKAARIPENELIDLFWKCFAEYQYWSMKALRQRLQQPENYIRQVLNDRQIAVLHKSGPFANHYSLTDQYKDKGSAKESIAVEDEDDDDGEEMEDVMPTS